MDIDQVDSSSSMSETQMDSLLSEETPSRDIPMKSENPAPPQEYTLKVGGKEIKAPLEKVLSWAQMGYDYPQKAQALKAQQEEFQRQRLENETKWKETESKWAPYKQIDEYAAKNPDWWSQVQQAYQQKIQAAETNPEIAQLKQELQEIKEFKNQILSEKNSVKAQEEDKQLVSEIESIRKSFPNLDFSTPDEDGKTLEMKVLQHAVDNNLQSFRVAFRDFYHDHLIGKAREEGKELASKEVQKRTKLGILGETSKPTKGLKVAENVRSKSYNDLVQEALNELKQA
jgi:hypothetical protein